MAKARGPGFRSRRTHNHFSNFTFSTSDEGFRSALTTAAVPGGSWVWGSCGLAYNRESKYPLPFIISIYKFQVSALVGFLSIIIDSFLTYLKKPLHQQPGLYLIPKETVKMTRGSLGDIPNTTTTQQTS